MWAPVALAAVAALAPTSAGASVRLTATPGLRPAFQSGVIDYVSRCVPGEPLSLSVSASNGDAVAIGSHPRRSGDFTVDVHRQAGAAVTVRVTSQGRTRTNHVRCLPQDFPGWDVQRHAQPQAQWYVLTPIGSNASGYVAIFDAHGIPVWWARSSSYGPWDGKLLPNGNLAWSRQYLNFFGVNPKEAWEEHGLDGRTVRVLRTVGNPTDIHDLEQLPNGHYLLDAYRPRSNVNLTAYGGPRHANVYDGEIQELTPDGKLVWSWNSKNHIALSENLWWADINSAQSRQPPDRRSYDLVHLNSVEPDGDGYIVSARFLDAVFRIDRKTKRITWKLGGTKRPESLAVKNDPLASAPFGGQHDARLYSDHTLTVFDNGSPHRAPRVVRYRIDTGAHAAKLVEGFDQSDVPRSGWGGSARKLPGGNWVIYWGGTNLMTERTPSGGRVLDLRFLHQRYSYRAFPIPRGRLSAQALRQGMTRLTRSAAAAPPAR